MNFEIDGKIIADNIRAERNRANVTMEAITEELSISRPTYIGYEKDAEKIKIGTLLKLAHMFGCTFYLPSKILKSIKKV